MKKKAIKLLSLALVIILTVTLAVPYSRAAGVADELRGVWVATVYNIDFTQAGKSEKAMKKELSGILDTAKSAGMNAIFFQVRPMCDAFYKSSLFPYSEYFTGEQGKAPDGGFDALQYMITEGKKRGIAIHAWINPYRVAMGNAVNPALISKLSADNPVRKNPEMAVLYDYDIYLDPGNKEAQKLIIDGVREIVANYDVAGVQFDDYFYPDDCGAAFDDSVSHEKYGKSLTLEEFRRQNTYELVEQTHTAVKSLKSDVVFGISPSGIWRNKDADPAGSDTNGNESYSALYADTRAWVQNKIIDYIAPQIYWSIGAPRSDFEVLSKWWGDLCKKSGVKFYAGQAAYKLGRDEAWSRDGELLDQIAMARKDGASGQIFYGYEQISENKLGCKDALAWYYGKDDSGDKPPVVPPDTGDGSGYGQPLVIGLPSSSNYSCRYENIYMLGTADPRFPVTLNGTELERTKSGHFSAYMPLSAGKNVFTFESNGASEVITVTRSGRTSEPFAASAFAPVPFAASPKASSGGVQTLTAKVKDAQTLVRSGATGGSDKLAPLVKGVEDIVTSRSNGYARLRSGQFVPERALTFKKKVLPANEIRDASLANAGDHSELRLRANYFAPYSVDINDKRMKLTIHNTAGAELRNIEEGPLVKSVDFEQDGADSVYRINFKNSGGFLGFTAELVGNTVIFKLKNPCGLAAGDKPLAGKTIVVDAGHGGSDPGALGVFGDEKGYESELNLKVAGKLKADLEAKGAKVLMTRTNDKELSLDEREEMIKASDPDLSISVHQNSLSLDSNGANVSGFLVMYREDFSDTFAESIAGAMGKALPNRNNRGTVQQGLSVCYVMECPSILVECGFINNPNEYELLSSDAEMSKQAGAIADGVVSFFSTH